MSSETCLTLFPGAVAIEISTVRRQLEPTGRSRRSHGNQQASRIVHDLLCGSRFKLGPFMAHLGVEPHTRGTDQVWVGLGLDGRASEAQGGRMGYHSSCVEVYRGVGTDLRGPWTAMTARRPATGEVNALPACPKRLGARCSAEGEHLAEIGRLAATSQAPM